MSDQADVAIIIELLGASASAGIVVVVVSMRSATGPRRGAEGTGLLVSGSTPFQQAVDPAGGPTDCPADLPLARMEIFLCGRKPLGSIARAFAGLDRRLGAAQHLGFCRPACNGSCHRSWGRCGGGRRRAVLERDRLALGRFPLGRDVANLHRRPAFDRSHRSVALRSECKPGGGVSDAGLLDQPEHVIGKSGQLGGRKFSRVGGTKAVAEMPFPCFGKGCLEQLHDSGRGRALPGRGCICAHPRTAPGSPLAV